MDPPSRAQSRELATGHTAEPPLPLSLPSLPFPPPSHVSFSHPARQRKITKRCSELVLKIRCLARGWRPAGARISNARHPRCRRAFEKKGEQGGRGIEITYRETMGNADTRAGTAYAKLCHDGNLNQIANYRIIAVIKPVTHFFCERVRGKGAGENVTR